MSGFNYSTEAELFPRRNPPSRRHPVGYHRFPKAADAIRFAIEELPPGLLIGTFLEVADDRYDSAQIRELYDSDDYPLVRRSANP
ncbi:MAG TPA: hypothetical protein VNR11_03885 [Xanthobacteraceae bacterium]|nr:hypothetical protein [Xanthobacteraceae bacterium]